MYASKICTENMSADDITKRARMRLKSTAPLQLPVSIGITTLLVLSTKRDKQKKSILINIILIKFTFNMNQT